MTVLLDERQFRMRWITELQSYHQMLRVLFSLSVQIIKTYEFKDKDNCINWLLCQLDY